MQRGNLLIDETECFEDLSKFLLLLCRLCISLGGLVLKRRHDLVDAIVLDNVDYPVTQVRGGCCLPSHCSSVEPLLGKDWLQTIKRLVRNVTGLLQEVNAALSEFVRVSEHLHEVGPVCLLVLVLQQDDGSLTDNLDVVMRSTKGLDD